MGYTGFNNRYIIYYYIIYIIWDLLFNVMKKGLLVIFCCCTMYIFYGDLMDLMGYDMMLYGSWW